MCYRDKSLSLSHRVDTNNVFEPYKDYIAVKERFEAFAGNGHQVIFYRKIDLQSGCKMARLYLRFKNNLIILFRPV